MVWDPIRITPTPWAQVVEFYARIADRNRDFASLRDLAAHVLGQPYAASIFAATSGTSLLIANTKDPNWVTDAMRIDVSLDGSPRFHLPERRNVKRSTFDCAPEGAVRALERQLRLAQWIG